MSTASSVAARGHTGVGVDDDSLPGLVRATNGPGAGSVILFSTITPYWFQWRVLGSQPPTWLPSLSSVRPRVLRSLVGLLPAQSSSYEPRPLLRLHLTHAATKWQTVDGEREEEEESCTGLRYTTEP